MKRLTCIIVSTITLLLFGCAEKDTRDPILIAAENGDPQAQFEWASKLESNIRSEADKEEFLAWLARASDARHQEARIQLSELLIDGFFGLDRRNDGLDLLEALANEGIASSQSLLARILEEGEIVEPDIERANALFEAAAEQDDPFGLFKIAEGLIDNLPDDPDPAVELRAKSMLTKAGKGGVAEAYYLLGALAHDDDLKQAEEYYYEAAKLGHPKSKALTGEAYLRLGKHPTYGPLGFKYLSEAAESGVTDALFHLSRCYELGIGTSPDAEKAEELNFAAAALQNQEAINKILVKIFKKTKWEYEDQLESAAWVRLSPSIEPDVRQSIHKRTTFSDSFFLEEVDYRVSQLKTQGKQYISNSVAGTAGLSENELEILDTPYSARFGDLEELYLQARSDGNGEHRFEFGKALLDPNQPFHDPEKGLAWIRAAGLMGNGEAGLFLYNGFKDKSLPVDETVAENQLAIASSSRDPEAMFLYAKLLMEEAESDTRNHAIMTLLVDAEKMGIAEADELIHQRVSEEKGLNYENGKVRAIIESLADSGNPRFQFLLAIHELRERESELGINSSVPAEQIAAEVIWTGRAVNGASKHFRNTRIINKIRDITTEDPLDAELGKASGKIFELAEGGNPDAKLLVSIWQIFGFYSDKDHDAAANSWVELELENGSDDVKLLRAVSMLSAFKEDQDIVESSRILRKLAENGDDFSKKFFSDLDSGIEANSNLIDAAHRATELDDVDAMLALANMYYRRDGTSAPSYVPDDFWAANYLKWMGEAAKKGHGEAMAAIGAAFIRGRGVEKNINRGIRYLEESAKLGYSNAQYEIGFAYAYGENVPKDIDKAIRYLEMAADNGHVEASNLVQTISSFSNNSFSGDSEEGAVTNAIISVVMDQDYFPLKPYIVADGALNLVVESRSRRGSYRKNGKIVAAPKKAPYVFLAGDKFHETSLNLTKLEVAAPIMSTENGVIYTGLEPSISFHYESNSNLENCLCLLVVKTREGEFTYNWRKIGNVIPKRKYSTRFNLYDDFYSLEDLSVYFFENGVEVLSDGRRQLQYFIDPALSKFASKRNEKIRGLEVENADPSFYEPIHNFIVGPVDPHSGAKVEIEVSEQGFVKEIEVLNAKNNKSKTDLLHWLSRLNLYPRIVDGKPVSSKIAFKL